MRELPSFADESLKLSGELQRLVQAVPKLARESPSLASEILNLADGLPNLSGELQIRLNQPASLSALLGEGSNLVCVNSKDRKEALPSKIWVSPESRQGTLWAWENFTTSKIFALCPHAGPFRRSPAPQGIAQPAASPALWQPPVAPGRNRLRSYAPPARDSCCLRRRFMFNAAVAKSTGGNRLRTSELGRTDAPAIQAEGGLARSRARLKPSATRIFARVRKDSALPCSQSTLAKLVP